MVMSWVWTGILVLSVVASLVLGNGADLAAAVPKGAQAGLELSFSLAGSICLWSGVGKLMEKARMTNLLSRIFSPLLGRIFPSFRVDPVLAGHLSSNVCANFLGLGNAATPLGLAAIKEMAARRGEQSSNGMMLFIILNTASLQLIPTYAITLRSNYGSSDPFAILPAVWIVSAISLTVCITAAKLFESRWRHE